MMTLLDTSITPVGGRRSESLGEAIRLSCGLLSPPGRERVAEEHRDWFNAKVFENFANYNYGV